MAELIFATSNRAKLAQLAFVIEATRAPISLIPARDRFGEQAAYAERGDTAAAVAQRGALEVAQRVGAPVLAEDTTFHVEALDGAPGVRAGQYLVEHGRRGILKALSDKHQRIAWITSAVCWATPEGDMQTWVTVVQGVVTLEEEWIDGLPEWVAPTRDNPLGGGYNAILIPTHERRTLAQIPPHEALIRGYREPNFSAALAFLRSYSRSRVGL